MTEQTEGAYREERPAPASTRWNEPDPVDDPGLMAPFVPGRQRRAPETPGPEPAPAEPAPAEPAPAEATAPEGSPSEAPSRSAEPPVATAPPVAAQPSGAEAEMAARLETLAARVRAEGLDGARAIMESDDRLSAVLAGIVAGHLASRG